MENELMGLITHPPQRASDFSGAGSWRRSAVNPAYKILAVFVLSLMAVGLILSNLEPSSGATSTTVSNVTVNSYLSFALSANLSNGVLFSSVNRNTKNNNASGNYNISAADAYQTQYWVYTGSDSNTAADFCIRNNESLSTGSPKSDEIGNTNFTFHNDTVNSATQPALSCAGDKCGNMTGGITGAANQRFATNVPIGTPRFLRFFLNVSLGQSSGTYSNTMTFTGAATGTSVTCGGT